jgi:hypothetical protein
LLFARIDHRRFADRTAHEVRCIFVARRISGA